MRVENIKLIWESELSELVRETYGRPYRLQQQGDCMAQDSMLRATVPDDGWFSIDDEPHFEEWKARDVNLQPEGVADWSEHSWRRDLWWDRKFYPHYQVVLNDLHARGLLEAGDYVIHVYW